jgi:hypothetical protein
MKQFLVNKSTVNTDKLITINVTNLTPTDEQKIRI